MPLKLFLLRHGQTALSRENAFCGSGTDASLTDEGRLMGKAFADHYATKPWTALYCSPLIRTRDTAAPLVSASGLALEIQDDLKEIGYGKWEGQTIESVKQAFPDEYARWQLDPARFAPTGGETAVHVAERGMKFITQIQEKHSDGDVLAVSHKATIRLIVCRLLGIDVAKYRFLLDCPVSSLTILEFGSNGPMLKVLADRSHLDERLKNLPGT